MFIKMEESFFILQQYMSTPWFSCDVLFQFIQLLQLLIPACWIREAANDQCGFPYCGKWFYMQQGLFPKNGKEWIYV